MEYACGVRFTDVSITEGWTSNRDAEIGVYGVQIEPGGWTLVDVATPEVGRHWPWDAIGAIESTPGGTTHDGKAAVTLDVVVNGWPVRLVFPAEQLPAPAVARIRSMAPAHVLVRCNPDSFMWALRRRASRKAQGARGVLVAAGERRVALGAGAAVTVALVLTAFGVAFGAGGPTTHAASNPVTWAVNGTSSSTADPATTAASTTGAPVGSSAPTTGASTTKPPAKSTSKSKSKSSSSPRHNSGGQAVTLSAASGPPSSESGPGTTTGTTTAKPPTGTTTTKAPATTTTKAPTTTTRPRPTTTTTRSRPTTTTTRPRPTTTTAPTTTAPTTTAPTTTAPTTTAAPTTTP